MKIKISILIFLLIFTTPIYASNMLKEPNVNTNSVYLVDYKTNTVVYSKNEHAKTFPASTTKILTALVVLDNLKLSDRVTVSENSIKQLPLYSSHVGLKPGENLTVKDLLYCLLLSSGNDAALVLAEESSNSIHTFVKEMNNKAKALGCTNSNFLNPHGFYEKKHYTTAYDMYLIMKEFMKNSDLVKIIKTAKYTTDATSKNNPRKLVNTNRLLEVYPYMIAGKTGYTEESGNTFIAASSNNSNSYIICMFNEPYTKNMGSKFPDTKILLEYAFKNFENRCIINKNTKVNSIIDYRLLTKKYNFLKEDLLVTVPKLHDNIITVRFDDTNNNEQIQANCKVSGLSTKSSKNVNVLSTFSTTISNVKEPLVDRLKKNFLYNLNRIKKALNLSV